MGIERVLIRIDFFASATDGVECLVPDNAEEPPAPGAASGVESCGLSPDTDKRIVQYVFGQLPVAYDALRNAKQIARVTFIELPQCLGVLPAARCNQ